jgi:hypothetical protein
MASSTPWGPSQTINKVCLGIAFVSTASHGGYRVSRALAENNIPKVQLDKGSIFDGRYYWFEEDCNWCIVAINFPQYFEEKFKAGGYPENYAFECFDRYRDRGWL